MAQIHTKVISNLQMHCTLQTSDQTAADHTFCPMRSLPLYRCSVKVCAENVVKQ